MEEKHISIAIDGPSGAGKSTLARMAAKEFGFLYVDTGAIYRTVGLAAQRAGITATNEAEVAELLPGLQLELVYDAHGGQRMLLNGEDVSEEIRTPRSSDYASRVSAMPQVREFLLEMQRKLARENDVVMDGRDIGTVVLPDAAVKIFLTADDMARAKRRYRELQQKGDDSSFETVLQGMRSRDKKDSDRVTAPLRQAEDAVLLDTSDMELEDSFQALCCIIRERFAQ